MEMINASVSFESEANPSFVKVLAGPEGNFMFMVGVLGINLNNPNISYFDITLRQSYFTPFLTPINQTVIPMVQCTPAHFKFNDDIIQYFARFQVQNALCPPLNSVFEVGGRVTSDVYATF